MKKQIAFVCTGLNELGGANNHLKNLYKNINSDEYHVTILCCSTIEKKLRDYMQNNGVSPLDLIILPRWKKLLIFPLVLHLKKIFKGLRIDIVHSFHIQSDIYSACAAKMAGVKRIFSCYESKVVQENMSFLKRTFYLTMNRMIKNWFDMTIVVSEELKNEMISLNFRSQKAIEVVPIGIELRGEELEETIEHDRLKMKRPVIGTIARFSEEKAIDRIIKAAPLILKQLPDAEFVLFGDGPQREYLGNLISELNISAKVEFKGWVDDVGAALRDIDIFIIPSKREGCPTMLLEAMLMRKSIIAANIDSIAAIVKDDWDGYLVNAESADSICCTVLAYSNDPKKSLEFGVRARSKIVEKFLVSSEVGKYLELYKDC